MALNTVSTGLEERWRDILAVHALHGEVKTVIKPLGRLFAKVSGIAGSAILGDGRVALVGRCNILARIAVMDSQSTICEMLIGEQTVYVAMV